MRRWPILHKASGGVKNEYIFQGLRVETTVPTFAQYVETGGDRLALNVGRKIAPVHPCDIFIPTEITNGMNSAVSRESCFRESARHNNFRPYHVPAPAAF